MTFLKHCKPASICVAAMIATAGLALSPARAETTTLTYAAVANFSFDTSHRERLVQATIWYPAVRGGVLDKVGGNAVFKPILTKRDAFPDGKRHPLILFSHGSGGNPATLAWIAKRLADAGFVVAMPTHQGTSSADSTPEQTVEVGKRSDDMSSFLDSMLASPVVSKMIDANDVTAMGFSLGGHTALSLVGANAVAEDYAKFCDSHSNSMDCVWFNKGAPNIPGHVDFHAVDQARFGASHKHPRIKRFVVVDPAFAQAYDASSLKAVVVPGLVLSMGQGNEIAATVDPDRLKENLAMARFETVAGANHFSFLEECTALANLWIWLDGDDPICRETGDRSRLDLHEEIARKILQFLKPTDQVAASH